MELGSPIARDELEGAIAVNRLEQLKIVNIAREHQPHMIAGVRVFGQNRRGPG
jgi:hypothetical protein